MITRILKRIALALGTIVVALLIAEIGWRLFVTVPTLPRLEVGAYRLSENPVLRVEYRPNYEPHQINSAGFRDREFTRDKPAGVTRIIVLGDSVTAGNGLRYPRNTYSRKLQEILNRRASNRRFEVLNMGVEGYHTLQEVETLRTKGLGFDPDVVIIGFCVNDFMLHADGGVYGHLTENASRDQRGSVARAWSSSASFLLRNSRLLSWTYHRFASASDTQAEFDYAQEVLGGRSTVEVGLELLGTLQREHGFEAYLFMLPVLIEDHGVEAGPTLLRLVKEHEFAGLNVVDLTPRIITPDRDLSMLRIDHIHPNRFGHELIATVIADTLLSQWDADGRDRR